MPNAAVRGTAYCLNYAKELGMLHGCTPMQEKEGANAGKYLAALDALSPGYEETARYAPNLTYVGAMSVEELAAHPRPWLDNLLPEQARRGKYGEIMPEDEFLGLMDICDVFELIRLEKNFVAAVRQRLEAHPLLGESRLRRLKEGHDARDIQKEIEDGRALPLMYRGGVAGCCRAAHETDVNLSGHVILENLACKASGLLALLHLCANAGVSPEEIDFVIECSEEAAGDVNQRGGGNFAKAVAEIAGATNASGMDIRAFCAAPVSAIISAASMVACGARRNVAVISGGSVPKLFMNSREHIKRGAKALENCIGSFAVLLAPDEGKFPVVRLDALGKHSVGAGAAPQAVTTALVWEPLQAAGLDFADVDKYAPELHIPEITVPGGAGNVPEANYKMIAALAVMKNRLQRSEIGDFVERHGVPGFAHTQGHIPSGVPYLGHAVDAIRAGKMRRAMIIGKGSLFLARLTNMADGASFLVEEPREAKPAPASVNPEDIRELLLQTLYELGTRLQRA
jgi:betaine reductase